MSEEEINPQEDNWDSYLSSFRHNLGGPVPEPLLEVDVLLSKMASAFDNIGDPVPPQLFLIGFASWRAALSLALSGAAMQASPLLRHSLEAAIYAFLFVKDPEWQDVWRKREIDKAAKEKFRRSGLPCAKARLKKESNIAFEKFESTYDHLIRVC